MTELVEHLFRHESGRMVSTLVRILGPRHLDLAEEVVQDALVRALDLWPYQGVPDNPTAWLIQVARNKALDRLRRETRVEGNAEERLRHWEAPPVAADDEAAMLLLCCQPELPRESQVALALKTVCGFSVAEIARAFLTQESTIAQRLVRAKRVLREVPLQEPQQETIFEILYLLFNEGYSASAGENLVRADLCDEAIRMARWFTDAPEGSALLSLFLLQSARLSARTDEAGELVLLEDQDRGRWDAGRVAEGFQWLDRSARGDRLSSYHVEAGIAAAHCVEPTDWRGILSLYDQLWRLKPTPIVALNRAVAVAKVHGADEGLRALPELEGYYLLDAVKARMLEWAGRAAEARACYRAALAGAPTAVEQRYLEKQIV